MTMADSEPAERLFVCTDLDRTLMPNGAAPESPAARDRFARLVARPGITLAYVTGRHRELVKQAIAEYALPPPQFVIGDVGTSIHEIGSDGGWAIHSAWQQAIAPDWNGLTNPDLASLLDDIALLQPQETDRQKPFKRSYYVPADADRAALDAAIGGRLDRRAVRARIVHSTDEPRGIGLVDVLPRRASKLHAIEYLMSALGFDVDDTFFSGDSGNDLEVLASRIPAVLVANAADDVRRTATALAAASGQTGRLFLASGGFLGMNGNYAAGILEGIAHFHPAVGAWIETDDTADARR